MACGGEERESSPKSTCRRTPMGVRGPSRIFQLRCFEFVVGGVHYLSVNEREGGREGGDGDGEDWGEVLREKSNPSNQQAQV